MQVIFHTGVHDTDNDRLLKCLLRNSQKLTESGVAVPGPGRYRDLLADSFNAMVRNGANALWASATVVWRLACRKPRR